MKIRGAYCLVLLGLLVISCIATAQPPNVVPSAVNCPRPCNYYLTFVSDDTITAISSNIGTYNTFVAGEAKISNSLNRYQNLNARLAAAGVTGGGWYALVSTTSGNANNNPASVWTDRTNKVFNVASAGSALVALNPYTMLILGTLVGPGEDVNQYGGPALPNYGAWTGTTNTGGVATSTPIGDCPSVTWSNIVGALSNWIDSGNDSCGTPKKIYAISGKLTCQGTGNPNDDRCVLPQVPSCLGLTSPNLVQNPGFEMGSGSNITDWAVAWPSSVDPNVFITSPGYNSPQSLALGPVPGVNGVSQMINTTANPNQTYMVCFWLQNSTSAAGSSFQAQWNGQNLLQMVDNAVFGWTYYSFLVYGTGNCGGASPYSCAGDLLNFQAVQIPSYYYLDDVSVQLCNNATVCTVTGQPPSPIQRGKQR